MLSIVRVEISLWPTGRGLSWLLASSLWSFWWSLPRASGRAYPRWFLLVHILFKKVFFLFWLLFGFLNFRNILFEHVFSSKPVTEVIIVRFTGGIFWALGNWWQTRSTLVGSRWHPLLTRPVCGTLNSARYLIFFCQYLHSIVFERLTCSHSFLKRFCTTCRRLVGLLSHWCLSPGWRWFVLNVHLHLFLLEDSLISG